MSVGGNALDDRHRVRTCQKEGPVCETCATKHVARRSNHIPTCSTDIEEISWREETRYQLDKLDWDLK